MKIYTHRNLTASLFIIMMVLGLGNCKKDPSATGDYSPNELSLLFATSNEGEVGPCG